MDNIIGSIRLEELGRGLVLKVISDGSIYIIDLCNKKMVFEGKEEVEPHVASLITEWEINKGKEFPYTVEEYLEEKVHEAIDYNEIP